STTTSKPFDHLIRHPEDKNYYVVIYGIRIVIYSLP
ncbi:MAG: hypothetical protein ACI8RD_009109, partial [Bacillariaceae sp.]